MPTVIDYAFVLAHLESLGMRCVYPDGGAFAFRDSARARSVGWVGPDDDSIRAEARSLVRRVPAPYERNLSSLLTRARQDVLPGRAWVMPVSHWAYELRFGSGAWMPGLLEAIGVDSKGLEDRNEADAIEFAPDEREALERFARALLEDLHGSDFAVAFPGRAVLCRVHHHKQLWWTTTDERTFAALDALTR